MKNIVFIVLLLIVLAVVYVIGSYRPGSVSSNFEGSGTLTEQSGGCRYENEEFGVGMTFGKDWVIYDGGRLETLLGEKYTTAELENMFGCGINELAYLVGFVAPDASMEITAVRNSSIPTKEFSSGYMSDLIDRFRDSVTETGGKWRSGYACIEPLADGGMVLIYYYEYDFLGKSYSVFCAKANANGDTIVMNGKYNGEGGLKTLTDFAKKLEMKSS